MQPAEGLGSSPPWVRGMIWLSAKLLAAERLAVPGLMFLITGLILLNVVTRYSGVSLYWVDESAIYSVVLNQSNGKPKANAATPATAQLAE